MKKKTALFLSIIFCFLVSSAFAEDVLKQLSINEALNNEKVKKSLYDEVALYWGDQPYKKIIENYGEFKVSKRTNAFMKSKKNACQWALASAIKVLQNRALREGGNAVINIKSNIKNNESSSCSDFSCLAGSVMVNVALKGTVVKLAE